LSPVRSSAVPTTPKNKPENEAVSAVTKDVLAGSQADGTPNIEQRNSEFRRGCGGVVSPTNSGNIDGMRSTIDSAGRIVLPKAAREAVNLYGGTEVEIRVVGDHLEIEPVPMEIAVVQKGSFYVAEPGKKLEAVLTVQDVEGTRAQIEQERFNDTRPK
jgi:AbrB family looped-hinge helix DNA binding protein